MENQETIEALNAIREIALANLATANAVLKMVDEMSLQQKLNQFLPLEDAAKLVSSGVSSEMLRERCKDGRFKYGVHYVNTSDGDRPNYLVKPSAVLKFFEVPPEKRPLPKKR